MANGRRLTQGQKKLLRDWFKGLEVKPNMWFRVEDLPTDLWLKLVEMHDTEILHTETERFIQDMAYDFAHSWRG